MSFLQRILQNCREEFLTSGINSSIFKKRNKYSFMLVFYLNDAKFIGLLRVSWYSTTLY